MILPLLLCLPPAAPRAAAVDLTHHQCVTLAVGESALLRLPCPHGGECRWELVDTDPRVVARGPKLSSPSWDRARGESVQAVRLTAVAPGRCTPRAVHADGMARPHEVVTIEVEVVE